MACQSNALEALPLSLGQSSSLTKLDASSNRIAFLPPQLLQAGGLAVSLAELNLSRNALRGLPQELGMLSKLKVGLSRNAQSVLPYRSCWKCFAS